MALYLSDTWSCQFVGLPYAPIIFPNLRILSRPFTLNIPLYFLAYKPLNLYQYVCVILLWLDHFPFKSTETSGVDISNIDTAK